MKASALEALAGLSAAIAIAAAAFGAHAAHGEAIDWLETGGQYQLTHAVAVILIAQRDRAAALILLLGSLTFALPLYAMAMGAPRWLGAVTPIGGALMIGGWLWFAYRSWWSRNASTSASDTDLST
jgi:uncharacterized membrane protein YgdD (TMEM256/DUF423 family)